MHIDIPTGVTGTQKNLLVQLQVLMEHARQGSYETRRRYARAGVRFLKWLADEFRVKRLANLSPKHLEAYAKHLMAQERSSKYIETELSALRWIHGQVAAPRNEIPKGPGANVILGVSHDSRAGVHREWTQIELNRMAEIAIKAGRADISRIIRLVSATGLRLNEVCTLRRHQAEAALRDRVLRMKGKNGKVRSIPIGGTAYDLLLSAARDVRRGAYLFCPGGRSIPAYKAEIEEFIRRNRDAIQGEDRNPSAHNVPKGDKSALSAHGLRYTYVQDEYKRMVSLGMLAQEAQSQVMLQVGHERRSEVVRYGVPVLARQRPLLRDPSEREDDSTR